MKRVLLIQQQHPPEEDTTPSSTSSFDLPSWHHSEILQLPHPKYHTHTNNNHTNNSNNNHNNNSQQASCSFVLNRHRTELYQLQCIRSSGGFGSFFHGHRYVIHGGEKHGHGHGGQFYTCTPFDITYLMIPLLERAQFVHNNYNKNNNKNDNNDSGSGNGSGVGVFIEEDDLIEKCFSQSGENLNDENFENFENDENGENVPFLVQALKPLLIKYNCLHNLCESQTLPSSLHRQHNVSPKSDSDDGQQQQQQQVVVVSRRVCYRIHRDRVLKWLSIKCDTIVQYLLSNPRVCDRILTMKRSQKTQQQHTTFRKSMKTVSEQASEQQQQRGSRPADEWKRQVTVQALRIMSDNVPLRWMKLLAEKRGVSELMYPKTTSASTATGDVNFAAYAYTESKTGDASNSSNSSNSSQKSKRTRSGSAGETEDGEKPAKKKLVTESRSVASLKKVDTSKMKSITSFFSPKKKKTEEAESTTDSK